ncbi:MAG: acyl-CoA desaturase [Bacteroidota bacterium]
MHKTNIRFNKQDRPEFIRELRARVDAYFKENKLSRHSNFSMVAKTAFMLGIYFIPLALMLTGVVSSFWMVTAMWCIMGFGMAGIGLSIMHDANHGAYSRHPIVNRIMSFLINFVGGYHVTWRIQHNVLHHSYTNIHGHDEDIDLAILRFSPEKEHKKFFRFQAFYAPFLYGTMTFYWFTGKDFEQLWRYHKEDLLKTQGLSITKAMIHLAFHKLWYVTLFLILPLLLIDLPWWQTLIGFSCMHVICSLIISFIFQTAHVIEETDFYGKPEDGSIENNWAIHQLYTTANFANGSRWFTWLIGGLNYQIEHHLFPNICHVHYAKIAKIVKQTAKEFNLPYHQHRTFFDAIRSHFVLLHALGVGRM